MDPNLSTGIIGKIADVQSIEWVKQWSSQKQVFIADFNGDGILQLNEWFMRTGGWCLQLTRSLDYHT